MVRFMDALMPWVAIFELRLRELATCACGK